MWNENFNDDLAVGKRGEKLVSQAMMKRGHRVIDVSDNTDYQDIDVDLVLSKDGITINLEVKNDLVSNYTGNVFVETYNRNNISRNGLGWFSYTEADYIIFVQERKKLGHIVSIDELARACLSNRYRVKDSEFSRGYIVPIAKLQEYSTYHCMDLR